MVFRAKEDFLWFKKKQIIENPKENWMVYLESVELPIEVEEEIVEEKKETFASKVLSKVQPKKKSKK